MGRNLYQDVKKWSSGPESLLMFILGVSTLSIGLALSWQDLMSSKIGLEMFKQAFGVSLTMYPWMIYVMSITPQIAQMVFVAIWGLDTSKWWWLVAAILWFLLDFLSDVQYQSGGTLFPNMRDVNVGAPAIAGSAVSIIWFTVGAELFIVVGSALTFTLLVPAIHEFKRIWREMRRELASEPSERGRKRQDNRPEQQNRPQQGTNQGANRNNMRPSERHAPSGGLDTFIREAIEEGVGAPINRMG